MSDKSNTLHAGDREQYDILSRMRNHEIDGEQAAQELGLPSDFGQQIDRLDSDARDKLFTILDAKFGSIVQVETQKSFKEIIEETTFFSNPLFTDDHDDPKFSVGTTVKTDTALGSQIGIVRSISGPFITIEESNGFLNTYHEKDLSLSNHTVIKPDHFDFLPEGYDRSNCLKYDNAGTLNEAFRRSHAMGYRPLMRGDHIVFKSNMDLTNFRDIVEMFGDDHLIGKKATLGEGGTSPTIPCVPEIEIDEVEFIKAIDTEIKNANERGEQLSPTDIILRVSMSEIPLDKALEILKRNNHSLVK